MGRHVAAGEDHHDGHEEHGDDEDVHDDDCDDEDGHDDDGDDVEAEAVQRSFVWII